jgi:Tol biopolymer transport system component
VPVNNLKPNIDLMYFIGTLSKKLILSLIITCGSSLIAFCQNIVSPGSKPEVFTQEGVATPNNESVSTFNPDGNTAYIADGQTIVFSKKINGKWTKPTVAPFSGQWKDWDPALSPDGKRLVFVSNRPVDTAVNQDKPQKNHHLWYVDHISGDQWSKPKHFDAPVNLLGFNDYGPSVSGSGTVCFCSKGRDGYKGMGGYYAKWMGDHYDKPKLLSLNGNNDIFDPFIAPDERYIIFVSNGELYISYRQGNDWTQGQKLGPEVNNGNGNSDPYVSPDGKMLYYSQDHAPGILMVPVNIPASSN